ncbi:ribosome hibernation-promoting factor, HPF/YfiA family [Pelagibacterium lentulum]|uniref:Ribosome hibernation promoting factor n=1 Tax=Pelagibacterium lentulum TaxID=2029865 RepID=A0A916R567_9HYPH|nr:ribosome-associated translation inhibitor RaiA [Pelagibacterium lentulum]GGA38296.1 ribosome hibernation promotion factor [Pelagibacterium lentulum]
MSLRVSGKNMDVGESLRTKAQDHFDAVVGKYFDGGYDGHLTLEPEGIGFRADCMVHLDTGVVLKATAAENDATKAYETMAEHIEKRLRRYKRKLKNHRRNSNGTESGYADYILAPFDDEEVQDDLAPPVIAESTQSLRTMSVGEAVMELDLAQSDVIVFRHAGHGGMNVVYRRADGNIGWIDPALAKN